MITRPPSRRRTASPLSPRREFVVRWRREGWSPKSSEKARRFWSERAALAFVARLHDVERLGIGRALVSLRVRDVLTGPWRDGRLPGGGQ